MLPCRRETWGYRGVRARPSGGFSAEIRFRGMRLGLGNFDTANETARAKKCGGVAPPVAS